MSSQPYPPTAMQPVAPPSAPSGARKPVLMVLGGLLLVAGVVAGLALLLKSSSSVEDHVKEMARAPAGCTTSLQFDSTGTFEVFVERTGRVGDLSGGCPASGESYDRKGADLPLQTLDLVDSRGRKVGLDDAGNGTYDAGGFRGTRIATVTIADPGEFKLTVTPDDPNDEDYAVSIGKDPTADEGTLRTAGIAALAAGIVIGGLLLILGLRRGTPVPARPDGPSWTPVSATAPQPSWTPQPPASSAPSAPVDPIWAPQPAAAPESPTRPPTPSVEAWSFDRPARQPDGPTQAIPPTSPFAPPRHPNAD